MKKKLLTAIAVMASLCGYAQTKGTSTLGLGINVFTDKTEQTGQLQNSSSVERKTNSFTLGYGLFVEDNTRIGIDLQYGKIKGEYYDVKSYGGQVSYQKYYPLVSKLYAYAGGRARYNYSNQEGGVPGTYYNSNQYSLGAYGGVTWFVSKRFAFETTLLSANATYLKSEQKIDGTNPYVNKQTGFNMTTDGFINDLGFKIYLLF